MGKFVLLCYDCHEELVHNPVFLPSDIASFARLARLRGLQEEEKMEGREKLGGRIELLHEVIEVGLRTLLREDETKSVGAHNRHLQRTADAAR